MASIPVPANVFVRMTHWFAMAGFKWSEYHFFHGVNTVGAAKAKLPAIIAARNAMLAVGASMTETTVSVEGVSGDVDGFGAVTPIPLVYEPDVGSQANSDLAWSSIRLLWTADYDKRAQTTFYRRSQYLSGVPDVEIQNPPRVNLSSSFKPVFDTWVKAMFAADMGYLTYAREPGTSPILRISTWLNNGDGTVTLTVPGHNFTANQYIRVYNCRSLPGPSPKGQFQIQSVASNTVTVLSNAATPLVLLNPGKCRLISPVVVPYQSCVYQAVSRRKRGTLSKPVRGRARSKKVTG